MGRRSSGGANMASPISNCSHQLCPRLFAQMSVIGKAILPPRLPSYRRLLPRFSSSIGFRPSDVGDAR